MTTRQRFGMLVGIAGLLVLLYLLSWFTTVSGDAIYINGIAIFRSDNLGLSTAKWGNHAILVRLYSIPTRMAIALGLGWLFFWHIDHLQVASSVSDRWKSVRKTLPQLSGIYFFISCYYIVDFAQVLAALDQWPMQRPTWVDTGFVVWVLLMVSILLGIVLLYKQRTGLAAIAMLMPLCFLEWRTFAYLPAQNTFTGYVVVVFLTGLAHHFQSKKLYLVAIAANWLVYVLPAADKLLTAPGAWLSGRAMHGYADLVGSSIDTSNWLWMLGSWLVLALQLLPIGLLFWPRWLAFWLVGVVIFQIGTGYYLGFSAVLSPWLWSLLSYTPLIIGKRALAQTIH